MTIEYSQDGATVTNEATIQGAPAILISGDDVHFTNSGMITGNAAGVAAIRVTGLNATIVNAAGSWISHSPQSEDAILGSTGNDSVVNAGIIRGKVRLGDGADSFTEQAGNTNSGSVEMGAGDDLFRHEHSAGTGGYSSIRTVDGGDGYDTLVVSGYTISVNGQAATGFEALELATGDEIWNLTGFSGFSAVTLGEEGDYNFVSSVNPDVDLAMSGGSLRIAFNSVFRDIAGSDSSETLDVRSSTIRNADLGGGADYFWYSYFPSDGIPAATVGLVDGGAGTDQIILSVGGGVTVDMAMTTGFENLNTGTWTSATSDVRVINANGYSRIDTDTEGRLVIGQSYSPGATVGLSWPTTLVLESTATVGHVGFDLSWAATITEGDSANNISVTNAGTVLGDVRLYSGNDLYDGRLGTAGGIVSGFAGDDYLRGGALVDRMRGGFGDDHLEGHDGHDQLDGGAGDDRIEGGAGNDILHLWNGGGDDVVFGGSDSDTLFFGGTLTAADVVNGGDGVDTLVLQGPYGALALGANVTEIENVSILAGSNTALGEPGTNRYDYVLTVDDANFAAGVQARINGAALLAGEDFTFDGSAETDALFVVYGGKGKDTLTGGLGNDIFFYAEERFANGDTVNGGSGYDGMFLRGNYTIDFNAPGYTGLFTSIENLTLTSATDERYARGGGTEFDYNLVLSDAIVGTGQQLTVSGALLLATETMVFDASAETDGSLRLFGGKASDTLKGGALADLIHGNIGADILTGGGGADAFRYQNVAESTSASRDQILDFAPGADKVELDRIDANTLVAGNQAFTWIGTDAFSGTAGELRVQSYDGTTTWLVEGDVDGNGVADLALLLTLPPTVPPWAGDFVL